MKTIIQMYITIRDFPEFFPQQLAQLEQSTTVSYKCSRLSSSLGKTGSERRGKIRSAPSAARCHPACGTFISGKYCYADPPARRRAHSAQHL